MTRLVLLTIGTVMIAAAQPGGFRQLPGGQGPGGGQGRSGARPGADQADATPVPPEDLCTLEGFVTNAETGEPLTKTALVLFRTGDGSGRRQPISGGTDAEGRFRLKDIEPGRYQLSATRNGFVRQEYGAKQPGRRGSTLTLNKGQRLADVHLALVRQAVITGRIQDEDGEALSGVQVSAVRTTWVQGRRQLTPSGAATTDDRGIYRIHGLPPGKYLVSALYRPDWPRVAQNRSADQASEETYPALYYPGIPDPVAAAKISVKTGGEVPGIDIRLGKIQAVSVRGHVENQTGGRTDQIFVVITPRSQASSFAGDRRQGRVDAKGNFEIRGVAPGSYTVSANFFRGPTRMGAHVPVEVGRTPVDGLVLTVAPGLELKGVAKVEGDATLPSGVSVSLAAREMPVAMPFMRNLTTRVGDGGVLSWESVSPGVYDVQVRGLNGGFYLKTVKAGPKEVLESGIDLTAGAPGSLELIFSPNGGAVEGTVTHDGKAVSGATVVLAPDGPNPSRTDLFRSATTDDTGHYVVDSLPPGKYRLWAFEDLEDGAGQDPEFLSEFQNAAVTAELQEKAALTKPLALIAAEGRVQAQ